MDAADQSATTQKHALRALAEIIAAGNAYAEFFGTVADKVMADRLTIQKAVATAQAHRDAILTGMAVDLAIIESVIDRVQTTAEKLTQTTPSPLSSIEAIITQSAGDVGAHIDIQVSDNGRDFHSIPPSSILTPAERAALNTPFPGATDAGCMIDFEQDNPRA